MRRIYSRILAACDRAAQTISRTALLSLGFAAMGSQLLPAQAVPNFEAPNVEAIKIAAVDAVPLLRPSGGQLQDGTYVFGESSLPDQADHAYMVFEVADEKVTGAVYWPQSSYDCFEGRFSQEQLALRVKETYTGEIYTHAIALAPETSILASTAPLAKPGLEGMHRFDSLTQNDQQILTSCQSVL